MMNKTIAAIGSSLLLLTAGGPAGLGAQEPPLGRDTYACVRLDRRPGTPVIRFVEPGEACGPRETRMLVIVSTTTPFASQPTRQRSGFVSTIVATGAWVPVEAPLLIETTLLADVHSAALTTPDGRYPAGVSCTAQVDGQRAGRAIEIPLIRTAPGREARPGPVDPTTGEDVPDPPRASAPDVLRSSLARFRQVEAGRHDFGIVCEARAPVRLPGVASLTVLQYER